MVSKIKRNIVITVVILTAMGGLIYGVLNTRAAGQWRQARFNVDVLGRIFAEYYRQFGRYPDSLKNLPKFYVVSIADRLSCDHHSFKREYINGYHYDVDVFEGNKFAISASRLPPRLCAVEYGITEKGQLKSNKYRVDKSFDSYEEIQSWPAIGRLKVNVGQGP